MAEPVTTAAVTTAVVAADPSGMIAIAAALAIGLCAIASAMAERDIGAAAVGAMAENENLFVKGLILTVIPETIVIFGLVISILLLGKI